MIGNYCKAFRVANNKTLVELGGVDQIKNLSAFEHGRSSNIKHLTKYIELSVELGKEREFLLGLSGAVLND